MLVNNATKDITIIFVVTITIIIYFLITQILSKKERKKQNTEITNKKLIQLNITIDRYNNLVQLFELNLKKIKQEALFKEDTNSLEEIIYIEDNFNKKCNKAINFLEKAKIYISEKKWSEYETLMNDSESTIEDMQTEMNVLLDVKIEDKRQKKQTAEQKVHTIKKQSRNELPFFLGCDTILEVEKRYKALVKAFHPDTGHGDEKAFQELQKAYERKKETL